MDQVENIPSDVPFSTDVSSPDIGEETSGLLPKHVAIIMDGNNRWAKQRGLMGAEGHRQGAKAVRATVRHCARLNIKALTVFAFSSENWRRPAAEVELLMQLFMEALRDEIDELNDNRVRLQFIGDLSAFSPQLRQRMEEGMALTAQNHGLHFNIAVNYGGRWDIAQAAKRVATQVVSGELSLNDIDEHVIDQYISLSDQPAVDLCIRTSGEERISNFLLWQIAYSEFYFAPCLWPDFDEAELLLAIEHYKGRQRRFGRTSEQVLSAIANISCSKHGLLQC